jgi:phosphoserine aminotransferase
MTINFSAGPGVLPKSVLQKAQNEFLNYSDTGVSIVEVSHRSVQFINTSKEAENNFRKLFKIPDNYKVLFMQGGASSQFSAVVYNLVVDIGKPIDYVITGQWSSKAYKEAKRLGISLFKKVPTPK